MYRAKEWKGIEGMEVEKIIKYLYTASSKETKKRF